MKTSIRTNNFLKHFFKWVYFIHYPFIILFFLGVILGVMRKKYNIGIPFEAKVTFTDSEEFKEQICMDYSDNFLEISQISIGRPPANLIEFLITNLFTILLFVISMLIFRKLFLLFKNVTVDEVFTMENVKLIKSTAILFIVCGTLSFVIYQGMQIYIKNSIKELSKISIDLIALEESFYSIEWIVLGLILLSLTQVFKRGIELQELEDQTV